MNWRVPFTKDKKDPKKRLSNLGETLVKVSVFRVIGKSLRSEIVKFDAIQNKDASGNLILINPDFDFKEDVDFVKEKVIEDLSYKLDLISDSKKAKITKVEEAIKQQETRLKNIRDGKLVVKSKDSQDKVTNVNFIDEDNRLAQLKVLRESLQLEGEYTHEWVDSNGFKHVDYKLVEGVLYPLVYYDKDSTLTPDKTAKRKNYRSEKDIIDTEYLNDKTNPFSGVGKILLWAIVIGLVGALIWGNVKNMERSSEITAQWDESYMSQVLEASKLSSIECANYLSASAKNNNEVVTWAIGQLNETKTQNVINSGTIDIR